MVRGFQEWLVKQNIVGLALAVVIGTALGKVVSAVVADLIMPLVGLVLPAGNWREFQVVLSRSVGSDGAPVVNALRLGDLLGALVDFIIIALVVYFVTKAFVKAPPPPDTRECPACREQIPRGATRCKFCTIDLAPGAAAA